MKKCASCTKDLPDAALHCVFCGAKQPPAPATAGSVAKTVMGHASPEMIEQLKAQAAAAARPNNPSSQPFQPPRGPSGQSPAVPAAGNMAPTMFSPTPGPAPLSNPGMGMPPMGGPMGAPMGGPMGPAPMSGPPMGGPSMGGPMGPGPMPGPGPISPPPGSVPLVPLGPSSAPPINPNLMPSPHIGNVTARAGRPIEPWKDSLRLMMFIFGGALILAFMTPLSTDPLAFMFNVIVDGEGLDKIEPILMVAIGLIAIVVAAIPMPPSARGLVAGLLGVLGMLLLPIISFAKGDIGLPSIMKLVGELGIVVLVPGLLLRSQYRDALLPRMLVTIGALCVLAPQLIPQGGDLPLVGHFTLIIDAPGTAKVGAIIELLPTLIAVLSLLAWLPAPSSGLALIWAWSLIALYFVAHFTGLFLGEELGAVISGSPFLAFMVWVPKTAYLVLTGFGLATVFGKQLE